MTIDVRITRYRAVSLLLAAAQGQIHVVYLRDVVAKVESCGAANFSRNKKREMITDSKIFKRITEDADKFNAKALFPHVITRKTHSQPAGF